MLKLEALTKSYGTRRAVDCLSLEVNPGEIFGLLGPNGAGKSTAIGMATGLIRPDAGSVTLHANGFSGSPTDPEARRHVGVAPQALAIYEELTAEENLALFGRLYGLRAAALSQRVADVLDAVGLTERRRSRVSQYSGGMKRRLNLGVAIIHDPPFLLLDEPTVGVDPQSRNAIFELLSELRRRGRAIVYTTHYMEEAQRLCDRLAIIDQGRILALGTVEDLIASAGGVSVIHADMNGQSKRVETSEPMRELARLLADPATTGLRVERADLETVFLKLTGRSLRD